jgi:hypothetical protein
MVGIVFSLDRYLLMGDPTAPTGMDKIFSHVYGLILVAVAFPGTLTFTGFN